MDNKKMFPRRYTASQLIRDGYFVIKQNLNHKDIPIHWHDFYEIAIIVSGCGYNIMNGVPYKAVPGSVFLLSPVDFHTYSTDNTLDFYEILFPYALVSPRIWRLFPAELSGLVSSVSGIAFEHITRICEMMYEEKTSGNPLMTYKAKANVEWIMVNILQNNTEALTEASPLADDSVRHALSYIHANFKNEIMLADVAKIVGFSPCYVSKLFHKNVGVSFQTYLRDLRLGYALEVLKNTDIPVENIAIDSGFNSAAHFSVSFREKYGRPPGFFRKTLAHT